MKALSLAGLGLAMLWLMSLTVHDQPAAAEPPRVVAAPMPARLPPMPCPPPEISVPHPGDAPELVPKKVKVKVTACSPHDSAIDKAYYDKNGYEGDTYNIAAHTGTFPRGTRIHVPGYMEKSYPGKFWEVDSAGGPVIRRSAAKGVKQIDVKYQTKYSADKWGVQWLVVDVITPDMQYRHDLAYAAWLERYTAWSQAKTAYDMAYDDYIEDLRKITEAARTRRGDLGRVP